MDYDLKKLYDAYNQHKSIIIGLDFDDTVFPLTQDDYVIDRCNKCVEAVRRFNTKKPELIDSIVCLYTNSDKQSLVYKKFIVENVFKIRVDYVNESPILNGNGKPFFNILLDDKAGLNESIDRLTKLTELIKLSDRTYNCDKCGNSMDRDLNASLNIKNFGVRDNPLYANVNH